MEILSPLGFWHGWSFSFLWWFPVCTHLLSLTTPSHYPYSLLTSNIEWSLVLIPHPSSLLLVILRRFVTLHLNTPSSDLSPLNHGLGHAMVCWTSPLGHLLGITTSHAQKMNSWAPAINLRYHNFPCLQKWQSSLPVAQAPNPGITRGSFLSFMPTIKPLTNVFRVNYFHLGITTISAQATKISDLI